MAHGPEEIRKEMEAILLAKQGLQSAKEAHARIENVEQDVREIRHIQAEQVDTQVTILQKLGQLTDILPELVIMAKSQRGKKWLAETILIYGKTAGALTAVAGLVYGGVKVLAGLPVW